MYHRQPRFTRIGRVFPAATLFRYILYLTPVDAAVGVDGFRNIFPGALQRVNEGADRRHEHFSSISGLVVERVGHGMATHGMSDHRLEVHIGLFMLRFADRVTILAAGRTRRKACAGGCFGLLGYSSLLRNQTDGF